MKKTLNRRQLLLSSAGGAAAFGAMSAYPLMAPNSAPDRVVFVFIPGGTVPNTWNPQECHGQLVLNETSRPLETVKQHCLFFDDLSVLASGHGNEFRALGMMFQDETSSTIDVELAKLWAAETELASLRLGVNIGDRNTISMEDGTPLRPETQPIEAYRALFSADEGVKGDPHPLHRPFLKGYEATHDNFSETVDMTSYLTALALMHDKTRVISLMWGDTQCDFPIEGFPGQTYHEILAGSPTYKPIIKARRFLTQKLAYLIQLLATVHDRNNRRLIDSTLVVGVTEMAEGINHGGDRAPYIIAGANHRFRNHAVVKQHLTQMELMEVIAQTYGVQAGLYGDVSDDLREAIVG